MKSSQLPDSSNSINLTFFSVSSRALSQFLKKKMYFTWPLCIRDLLIPTLLFFLFNPIQDVPRFTFGRYETIALPVEPKFESIQLDPKLARQLSPTEIRAGLAVATVTGNLVVKNNK